jgi:hypothetical protein
MLNMYFATELYLQSSVIILLINEWINYTTLGIKPQPSYMLGIWLTIELQSQLGDSFLTAVQYFFG